MINLHAYDWFWLCALGYRFVIKNISTYHKNCFAQPGID